MNLGDQAMVDKREQLLGDILLALAVTRRQISVRSAIEIQKAIARYTVGVLDISEFANTGPILSEAMIRHVCCEIQNGRGQHGNFLHAFANAMLSADPENFRMMAGAARRIIGKYGLDRYLDTLEEKAKTV
jgi:hypothetical protein